VQGASAKPDDEELRRYLAAQPIPNLPKPAWLGEFAPRAAATDFPEVSPPIIALSRAAAPDPVAELAEQIRPLWQQMQDGEARFSKSALARHVGQRYAGSWAAKIDEALLYLEESLPAPGDRDK
jgi:hypothetical protein